MPYTASQNNLLNTFRKLRSTLLPVCLLLAAAALGAIRAPQPGGNVAWHSSLRAARTLAQRQRRPLLVWHYLPGSPWCAKMDAETFTSPRTTALMRSFVCVRLNSALHAGQRTPLPAGSGPMLMLYTSQGQLVTQQAGCISSARMLPLLHRALAAQSAATR